MHRQDTGQTAEGAWIPQAEDLLGARVHSVHGSQRGCVGQGRRCRLSGYKRRDERDCNQLDACTVDHGRRSRHLRAHGEGQSAVDFERLPQ